MLNDPFLMDELIAKTRDDQDTRWRDAPMNPTPPTQEALEELRRLSEAATPGPWQPYIAYSGESGTPDEVGIYAGAGTTHHGSENTVISDFTLYVSEALADYEFIVAAVNYVRSLLASDR